MKDKIISAYKQIGKELQIRVEGTSMTPLIQNKSIVFADISAKRFPVAGEICLFKNSEGYVVHRVIRIFRRSDGSGEIIEKGDASLNFTLRQSCDLVGIVTSVSNQGCNIRFDNPLNRYLNRTYGLYWEIVYMLNKIIINIADGEQNRLQRFIINVFTRTVMVVFRMMTWFSIKESN